MRTLVGACMARVVLVPMLLATWFAAWLGSVLSWLWSPKSSKKGDARSGVRVTVIVTFYNANWCRAHLAPIAAARNVEEVTAIVDGPTAPIPGVNYIYPPRHLERLTGRIIAKLLMLFVTVARSNSQVVIGYFLVPNGLCALITARLLGKAAIYQNTVGPTEIMGGGALTDNRILQRLHWSSWLLERLTFAITRRFDAVVVRGGDGVRYLRERNLTPRPVSIVGAIDCDRFAPGAVDRCYDLITVARLVDIKQPRHILEVVKQVRQHRETVRAILVGDGPLLDELVRYAEHLGISDNVSFMGQVDAVEELLKRSKVFILTSRMEGLSIALAEAMACGIPAVVSDVGELKDLVENGSTGWRVTPGDINGFADRVLHLLESPIDWQRFSAAARRRAFEHNGLASVAKNWERLLGEVVPDSQRRSH